MVRHAGELGAAYEQALGRARRRAEGVFYTPAAIVDEVVRETLAPLFARCSWRRDGSPRLRILDPAAGAGRFLVAATERCTEEAAARGFDATRARRAIVRRCMVGIERDPQAASLARAALGLDNRPDVRVAEALFGGAAEDGAWDAVIGNPPWIRSIRLAHADPGLWRALRGAFAATSFGEWDLSAAFIERALAWAAPGGEVGLVTPSRWLTAAFAAPLRAHLAAGRSVRRIVDHGDAQVFTGATTYTALVYLTRREGGAAATTIVRQAARGAVTLPRDGAPWRLSVGALAKCLARIAQHTRPLGELARIAKGAGSNADPIFLLDPASAEGARLEASALVPCVRGRDITPWAATPVRQALLPYDLRDGRTLTPEELRARWPRACAYLERHRDSLEARERGRFAGPTFYRWGRPQNLVWLADPGAKIVVPDAAARGRAAIDRGGTMVIDTAYAIRPLVPREVPIGLLLAILNSPIVAAWLRATGIPLRGGYFRMKTAYLASLPIPDPSSPAARALAADALRAGPADDAEMASRVAGLYGVDAGALAAVL